MVYCPEEDGKAAGGEENEEKAESELAGGQTDISCLQASHFLVVHYDDAPTVGPEDVSLAELLVPSLKHQPPNNVIFRIKEPPKRPPSK